MCFETTTFVAGDSHDTAFREGQRAVVLFIQSMLNKKMRKNERQSRGSSKRTTFGTKSGDPTPNTPGTNTDWKAFR